MKNLVLGILMLMICTASCKKSYLNKPDTDEKPGTTVPTIIANGTLRLKIRPADVVMSVQISKFTQHKFEVVKTIKPNNTEETILNDLLPGSYRLNLTLDPGYENPGEQSIVVHPGPELTDINFSLKKKPEIGNVIGQILPAGEARRVVLISKESSNLSFETIPDKLGNYKFSAVPPGNYYMNIYTRLTMFIPVRDSQQLVVKNGETTEVKTVTVKARELIGSFSFEQNGALKTWEHFSGPSSTLSSVSSVVYSGTTLAITVDYGYRRTYPDGIHRETLSIILDDVTGPGKYICKGKESSAINYTRLSGRMGATSKSSTSNPGGEGSVEITSIDRSSNKIEGTFSAITPATVGNTNTFRNGRFVVTYE